MPENMTDELVTTLLDDKPVASLEIIEHLQEANTADDAQEKDVADSQPKNAGVYVPPLIPDEKTDDVFDPAIHEVDENGQPRKTLAGKYRRRRGRKSGQTATTRERIGAIGQAVAENPIEAESAATAAALVSTMFVLCVALGGEEWQPVVKPEIGLDEPRQLTMAWKTYFVACGGVKLPIWAIPLIATLAYAGPRFTMPKTQTRFMIFWNWLKLKYAHFFGRR